jgi:hypothetical protein
VILGCHDPCFLHSSISALHCLSLNTVYSPFCVGAALGPMCLMLWLIVKTSHKLMCIRVIILTRISDVHAHVCRGGEVYLHTTGSSTSLDALCDSVNLCLAAQGWAKTNGAGGANCVGGVPFEINNNRCERGRGTRRSPGQFSCSLSTG